MYALNINVDSRIMSATYEKYAAPGMPIVEELPDGNIDDYLYVNGGYVYDPIPAPPTPRPSRLDTIEAQTLYTAAMTDTLLEE